MRVCTEHLALDERREKVEDGLLAVCESECGEVRLPHGAAIQLRLPRRQLELVGELADKTVRDQAPCSTDGERETQRKTGPENHAHSHSMNLSVGIWPRERRCRGMSTSRHSVTIFSSKRSPTNSRSSG